MSERGVRRRGFTLTEMLVVLVIIIVLLSILLPAISGARNKARRASTQAFMSSIQQAIAQFRAAEQRLPGYFTVKDVGGDANYTEPGAAGKQGLTYLENALLELAGGISDDQDSGLDLSSGRLLLSVDSSDQSKQVYVSRGDIGGKDGPGYLDLPEGFVDMGQQPGQANQGAGRAGKWLSHKLMPRLVDAWGIPILMWPRDEFARRRLPLVMEEFDPDAPDKDASFYWVGNSAFVNAPSLGKKTQKSQWAESTLSSGTPSPGEREKTLAALVGHPAFPDPASLGGEPQPAEPRGDVILESAGPGGIYLETKDWESVRWYHYIPDGFQIDLGDDPTWLERANYIEKSDDIILSGS